MVERQSRKVIVYDLYVDGVFGRNRTPKFKSWKVAEVPEAEPLTLQEVEEQAKEILAAEVKLKRGVWKVVSRVDVLETEGGVTFRKTSISLLMGQPPLLRGTVNG